MTKMRQRAHLDGRDIDAVLIDAGGVLVDPNWRTVASVLERHGIAVDPARLAAAEPMLKRELDDADLIGATTDIARREKWLRRLLRHAGVEADPAAVDIANDELDAIHLERGIWDVVLDGVPAALDALGAVGLRLAVASNSEPLLRSKLAELDLAHRFDHLAISGEAGIEKPDPRFFLDALAALDVPPERALHVGDLYEVDVVGARSAGLAAVMIDAAGLYENRDVPRIPSLARLPALLGI